MAEYIINREESIHILPDNVTYLSAALTEPLACGIHACLEKVQVGKYDIVCVFGPGTIGLLLSLVAKSQGAKVIIAGISKDEKRLKLAKTLGLIAVNQQKEDLKSIVLEHSNNKGCDYSFECSGAVIALNTALKITKKCGSIVQMGVFPKDFNEIDTQSILQKEINIIGSRSQKPSSWKKALQLLRDETVIPENIVTSIIPLENWRDGFTDSTTNKDIKVIIDLTK